MSDGNSLDLSITCEGDFQRTSYKSIVELQKKARAKEGSSGTQTIVCHPFTLSPCRSFPCFHASNHPSSKIHEKGHESLKNGCSLVCLEVFTQILNSNFKLEPSCSIFPRQQFMKSSRKPRNFDVAYCQINLISLTLKASLRRLRKSVSLKTPE